MQNMPTLPQPGTSALPVRGKSSSFDMTKSYSGGWTVPASQGVVLAFLSQSEEVGCESSKGLHTMHDPTPHLRLGQ